jgi:histidinol dehydrogenase
MLAIPPDALRRAAEGIPEEDAAVIREAARRIRAFHEAQKENSWFQTAPDGVILGQMVTPVARAGLYVPGGQGGETPLISSLLMNAVPALIAGVNEIAVVSPPRADGTLSPHILAAAHILGITEVYAAGSAWAIAALAYGAGPIKAVDLIAGPGNIWVTTAKRLLLGRVGIDMLAGPSEICIIAGRGADPAWIAADMLSQAEHDALASAVCITPDDALAERVQAELERQLALLPRAETAKHSLADWGALVLVPDISRAVAVANAIAPEHLELCIGDPWAILPLIRNAGAVFMGHHTAEPVGDYFAGPNHVLPTMGTARFASALSVHTFCKKISVLSITAAFTDKHGADIARLARLERLEAHARAVEARLGGR